MRTYVLNNQSPSIKEGEFNSSTIGIIVPEDMRSYNLFLVFMLPSGEKVFTSAILLDQKYMVTYALPAAVLSETGRVQVELQGFEATSYIKSVTYGFTVVKSLTGPTNGSGSELKKEDYLPWYTEAAGFKEEVEAIAGEYKLAEAQRVSKEIGRVAGENARGIAENNRVDQEDIREENEEIRIENEQTRKNNLALFDEWVDPLTGIEARLDAIITTPVEGVSAQEIIDARGGEVSVGAKIRSVDEQVAQIMTLASKVEGSIDDTTQIQNAIDTASNSNGLVKLSKNKIYTVGSLIPKANVIIDLNGSTLKLKNNANVPLIYDWLNTSIRSNFGLINGTLDCNMINNSDAINQSAGTLWLTNWDNLYFRNITVINAFRNVFNFFGVRNVIAENIVVKDCGRSNLNGFFSYGFSVEHSAQRRSSNIVLKNFICENMYGFGVHLRRTDGFELSNLTFTDLNRINDAIAITLTEATHGKIDNVTISKATKTFSIDGHAIEVNHSKNITLENISIDSVRTNCILFGDNNSGLSSSLVKLVNIKTTNTANFAMSVNYIDGLVVENCEFDKGFTNTYNLPTKNVLFNRCKFSVVCNALMTLRHFGYRDTVFSNLFILEKINETVKLGYAFSLADTETKTINLEVASIEQMFVGDVDIVTKWSGNFGQGSYAKYNLYAYGNTVKNSVLASKIAGSFERIPTITFSGNNLIITNSTGGFLTVNVLFQNKSITAMGLS